MHMSDKKTKQLRRRRGMTLIEIMVVITILGLIMAAVGVSVIPKLEEAKQDTARMDIKTIQNAMKLYYTKKGKYPDTGTGLKALVDTNNLEKIPVDPWGNEYIYMNEGGKPVITSYGADGTVGGEGPDGDISSRDTAAQK
ncbi:type II secretion system major pseudopilin GspG [Archangium primigenium]|uniref:type II secretion system major pseudopilin GspG n=1 Tax=[Archangium] primigenium TaxID=2792470 RepID=UPI001958A36C|nr:type II secretion system major pseudopilin GspG [Archangium primigenium]MBM7114744.1 type II secretion system major pseudopilin GspG [Archangium primigenium]